MMRSLPIENKNADWHKSEERLKQEKEIVTPFKTLYWDYYEYVLHHPILWDKPTVILYGAGNQLCEFEYVESFAKRCHADLAILENGEHHFHTKEQLSFYRSWLKRKIQDQSIVSHLNAN